MNNAVVKPVNPENLGATLHLILTKKDPFNTESSANQINNQNKIKTIRSLIPIAYSKYLKVKVDLDGDKPINVRNLRSGDIIMHSNRVYVVTITFPDNTFNAWPELPPQDQAQLSNPTRIFRVIRPNLSSINNTSLEELNSILKENSAENKSAEDRQNEARFLSDKIGKLTDGYLQVGDLGFLVDPTQISFNTQNGYQYFPTVRTAGNPKIPTMQQVKNISISLIFPNEDSINYQLLNLFAMFKRTPFVNIRNKDICSFFKEICSGTSWPNQWVSVALESIHIQSVEGFPNTLQAQVTFLPFDPKAINGPFEGLATFKDVKYQQDILYKDQFLKDLLAKAEAKLNDESVVPERAEDVLGITIDRSPNFKESLPFRAFYQSLIGDRNYVKDENGNNIPVFSNGEIIKDAYSLEKLRPNNRENFLYSYKAEDNKKPIKFKYRYFNGSFRDIASQISNERFDVQVDTLQQLNSTLDQIQDKTGLVRQIVNTFLTKQDFFNEVSVKFNQFNNIIPTLLASQGITLDSDDTTKPIQSTFGLLMRGLSRKVGFEQSTVLFNQVTDLVQGKFEKDTVDVPGLLRGVLHYETGVTPIENAAGVTTAQAAIDKIWAWLEKGSKAEVEDKKSSFAAFLFNLRQTILTELGVGSSDSIVIARADPGAESPFKTFRLPITEDTIIIDNAKDITISWSLTFNNKFIPITLSAYKYPYYQHIGHDDINMSLNITSVNSNEVEDLKTKLSLLSERLQETVKIITYTAPELITYLDSRIIVDVPLHHVFKVFGVDKVVYDTSNSTNIQEQPGSWSTNLSLTQAKFTIQDYHSIDQESSDDIQITSFAKLLAATEIENNRYVVKTFGIVNNDEIEEPSLDDIIRSRFFLSSHGKRVINYINQVIAEAQNKRSLSKNNKLPINSEVTSNEVIGAAAANVIDKQSKEILGSSIMINDINATATNALNKIANEYPEVDKIIKFIISKFDSVMEQQADIIINLIQPNKSLFTKILDSIGTQGTAVGIGIAVGLFFTGAAVLPIIAASLIGIGAIGLIGIDLAGEFAKNAVINTAGSSMVGMIESFNSSIAGILANDVVRDPVIRNKLFTEDIFGSKKIDTITSNQTKVHVNCYKDFDIPAQFGEVLLSPDFYLYNQIDSKYDIASYVTSAVGKYAKIGKLHAMMSLVESTESIKKYDELISASQKLDPDIKNGVENVLLKESFSSNAGTLKELIEKLENTQVVLSRATNNLDDGKFTNDTINEYIDAYIAANPREKAPNKSTWDYEFESFKTRISGSSKSIIFENQDLTKINLINAARIKTLIEIFEVYTHINEYYRSKLVNNNLVSQVAANSILGKFEEKNDQIFRTLSKSGAQAAQIAKLRSHIMTVLKHAENITTATVSDPKIEQASSEEKTIIKEIASKMRSGLASSTEENWLSLPDIKNIQSYLYNKIGYYIRLNTFIHEYNLNPTPNLNFDSLPELQFLKFWNFRSKEAADRKTEMLKQFMDQRLKRKDTTIKMFPAFKIYFIEEDKTFYPKNLDDYFSYDAIQSIEIVSNKSSAGKTAIIRLSNVTNTLTDRLSLFRERSDFAGNLNTPSNDDNLFFGTLDIKPGTSILIKMGYGPHDSLLDIAFQGRIIEMTSGPVVELVCQSYGAQLNHHVVAHKFGLLSTTKDHGDVASSILDMIPGLENLGKISTLGSVTHGDFTGRNIKNSRGKLADKFLMSNLLGGATANVFAQDNPRDENIYLPYSHILSKYHKPTFDWVIFDQSVWEAMKELCLYHRDTIPVVRSFNDDRISKKKQYRETLVIGEKSGYYKYTDAFALSSLNIKQIEQSIEQLPSVLNTIKNISLPDNISIASFFTGGLINPLIIKPEYKIVYTYLQKRLNALVLSQHILKNTELAGANDSLMETLSNLLGNNSSLPNAFGETITALLQFAEYSSVDEDDINTFDFKTDKELAKKFSLAVHNLYDLMFANWGPKVNTSLSAEDFYNVKSITDNIDPQLAKDPQYKKIQSHHLISDVTNLISNNIALSSNFANAVNLYYTNEPKLTSARLGDMSDAFISKKLQLWQTKAFGDLRDEHTRPLNSYQKNIDANWFDITKKNDKFFKEFRRIRDEEDSAKKINKYLGSSDKNKDIPNWQYFPSFVMVAVRLLQQEVEKMYQGTIEIIGDTSIQPYDILHIDDRLNDMIGTVEVEEVIHSFTPERGFRTIITPNLVTYDRNPIQLQDVQIINQIYDFYISRKRSQLVFAGVGAGIATAGGISAAGGNFIGGGVGALTGLSIFWNNTVNAYKKNHKFLYDMMGNILGRDCINFTALVYHGVPYVAGFNGVDYTNLKTLMNHNVLGVKSPIARFAAFSDPLKANITTNFNPDEYRGILWSIPGLPFTPEPSENFKSSLLGIVGSIPEAIAGGS
jgi:hypothetical protein